MVELVRPEMLPLGALPVVVLLVVGEARRPVPQRAPVGVRGEPLEHDRSDEQEARVTGDEHHLRAHVSFAAVASSPAIPATPSGSEISVKRMSSGSSSVTRLTV